MKRFFMKIFLVTLLGCFLPVALLSAQTSPPVTENPAVDVGMFNSSVDELEASIIHNKQTVADVQKAILNDVYLSKDEEEAKGFAVQEAQQLKSFQREISAQPLAGQSSAENMSTLVVAENISSLPVDLATLMSEPDKKIILDFEKMKLEEVLRVIGEEAGVNTMVDPSIKDQDVMLHLKNVTASEAIKILLQAYKLAYTVNENSIFISTQERIASMASMHKVIHLRNVNAEEAKGLVQGLVQSAVAYKTINVLLVIGTASQIAKAEEVIAEVDKPRSQVLLITQIIEIDKDALSEVGVDWSDEVNISFQESIRDPSLVGTTIAKPVKDAMRIYRFDRTPLQLDATIKMLVQDNKAKVLSNPKIATISGEEASIFIGDRIPYEITTVTGGVASTEVRFTEAGVRLNITPSIITEDYVVVNVKPEVSFIYSWRGQNDQYPWVKTRQAFASVKVKNNQPFILGGLLSEEEKKNIYKVPLLGNIPFLGWFFRYEKTTKDNKEIIITVIPQIVKD